MNDAHKVVKYKLEGPASKIRIQNPSQKAFVLLQAAIGQHYLDDYTLRQEMSMSVEYASRMLTAIEDYSIEESKHGKVALEALMLRRNLATSLWGAGDYVLNQLRGVGAKTAAKLAMNKIRTFDDISSKSSNEIEQACGRKSPFGQELKNVVSKLMTRSLRVSAYIEGMESDTRPKELVCHLTSRLDAEGNELGEANIGDDSRILTYTLSVHTDRAGGSLMFRKELSGPSSHRIKCPIKFGRMYVRIVSNLVGLDDQVYLEGNDVVEKSMFLSPKPAKKPTAVTTVKSGALQSDKILSKSQLEMVDGVHDFRMSQRKPLQAKKSHIYNSTSASAKRDKPNESISEKHCSPSTEPKQHFVTPSPSIHHRQSPTVFDYSPRPIQTPTEKQSRNEQFRRERTIIRDPKRCKLQHGSWQIQKKKQKQFQQRAFGSPKENPFSKFRFDPNNVEGQLEIESSHPIEKSVEPGSIIPPSVNSTMNQYHSTHFDRRSRFLSKGIGTAKSPSTLNTFVGSTRRGRVGIPYQLRQDQLLHQKAAEQKAYLAQNYGSLQPNYNQNHKFFPSNTYNSTCSSSVQRNAFSNHGGLYDTANDTASMRYLHPGFHSYHESNPPNATFNVFDVNPQQMNLQEAPHEPLHYWNMEPDTYHPNAQLHFTDSNPFEVYEQETAPHNNEYFSVDDININRQFNFVDPDPPQLNVHETPNENYNHWSIDPKPNPNTQSGFVVLDPHQSCVQEAHTLNPINQERMEGMVINVDSSCNSGCYEDRRGEDTFESAFF